MNSVAGQASRRMDVTRLQYEMSKFTYAETGDIRRLPHRWQRTVYTLGDHFDGLQVLKSEELFKLLVCFVISDK